MRALASPVVRRSASIILALFLGAQCYFNESWMNAPRVAVVAGALAGFAGAMFGTIFAAASLLVSGGDRRLIHNMRMTGHLRHLSIEVLVCSMLWLSVAVLCVLALLFDGNASRMILSAAVAVTVLGLLVVVAVGRKMALVLRYWGNG